MEDKDDIFTITSVPPARQESIKYRKRRYLIAMSIRVACFLGMVLLPVPLEWKIALAAGAIFLPYVAVVAANAYDTRHLRPGLPTIAGWDKKALSS